jgi:hypothetical protein
MVGELLELIDVLGSDVAGLSAAPFGDDQLAQAVGLVAQGPFRAGLLLRYVVEELLVRPLLLGGEQGEFVLGQRGDGSVSLRLRDDGRRGGLGQELARGLRGAVQDDGIVAVGDVRSLPRAAGGRPVTPASASLFTAGSPAPVLRFESWIRGLRKLTMASCRRPRRGRLRRPSPRWLSAAALAIAAALIEVFDDERAVGVGAFTGAGIQRPGIEPDQLGPAQGTPGGDGGAPATTAGWRSWRTEIQSHTGVQVRRANARWIDDADGRVQYRRAERWTASRFGRCWRGRPERR